jgi:uncharacterized protein (TIGR02001 family)
MKKLLTSLLLAAGVISAHAEVTGNLGVTSDYRFRGVSQTQNGVAVQGGLDYAHASGLYVGNWNSSVSSELYPHSAGVESDLYAGYKKNFGPVSVDVGVLTYQYSKATTYNTTEAYAAVGYGPVTLKESVSLGDYFGTANSKHTTYSQADVAVPVVGKLTAVAHAGHTRVLHNTGLDYTDYKVGATYDLNGYLLNASYYTNKAKGRSFETVNTVNNEKLFKNAFVVGFTKTF